MSQKESSFPHLVLMVLLFFVFIFISILVFIQYLDIGKIYLKIERQNKNLEVLYQISLVSNSSIDSMAIINDGLNKTIELMGLNYGGIYLLDKNKNELVLKSHVGLSEEYVKRVGIVKIGEGTAGKIAALMQPQFIEDLSALPGDIQEYAVKEGLKTTVSVPLKSRGALIGIMNVTTNYIKEFTRGEMDMINIIGNILGDGIAHAETFSQITQSNEELSRLNEIKDNFVAMITHELRTPLMAVKEGVVLCRQRVMEPISCLDSLSFIESSVSRLIRLIDNLWSISHIEFGRITLNKKEININNLIKVAANLMGPLINNKEISVSYSLTEPLKPVFVDTDRILQIILNLIDNAIKFTQAGGKITIGTKQINQRFIEVSIKDTGIGMSPDEAVKIFEKIPGLSEDDFGKLGVIKLGLRLCKLFVEMHGGEISLKSEPNKGSDFIFTLPILAQ
ncbi:MAG: GAF domain-containing sensor histidine kinase [Planctomycetota bacterium]